MPFINRVHTDAAEFETVDVLAFVQNRERRSIILKIAALIVFKGSKEGLA